MKRTHTLALVAAVLGYALIVLGAVVRITGSGMGCGDDWPLCNGRLIPALSDVETLLEWGHRQVAALLTLLVLTLAGYAWAKRSETGGPGGPLKTALLAVALLVVQIMLGAVTVWLELPPATVILHLSVAFAFLTALQVTVLRAKVSAHSHVPAVPVAPGGVYAAIVLGAFALLFGGLTANLGAGPACQGFPLCNGQIWPGSGGSGLPHVHWAHRLVAYALFLHLGGLAISFRKKGASERMRSAAWLSFALVTAQVVVAAVMVLAFLPAAWRGLHVAVGTALWMALVWLVWELGAESRQPTAVS